MNDLDKQLAELQLLNNSELPPNPSVYHTSGKKVGPAVPPKPKKPQPQVKTKHNLETQISTEIVSGATIVFSEAARWAVLL